MMINFYLKPPAGSFIRPPANYYASQQQQNRMPMNYNQPMMVPIDHQVYQPQQRPSLIIQQPNVVPQPPPNAQYISYDPNTGGYQQQPQPSYPPQSTYITFNSNYSNGQPQQPQIPQQPKQSQIIPQQQQQPQPTVVTTIPQIPQQQPLKRERKPIIITDLYTRETFNLKDKGQYKTEQTATTQLNTDNKQSITTSTSNRNINSQQQQQNSATSTTTSAPISTNHQQAKALQLEFSLSVLKKINESSNKTITAAVAPNTKSTQQQQQQQVSFNHTIQSTCK
jgi:hypothetical protein